MRPSSRVPWPKFLVLAVASTLVVSGCSATPEPAPPPTASPTALTAPFFDSHEDALAAATQAYAAYSEQAAALFSTPGSNPELIRTVASEEFADALIAEALQIRADGLQIAGQNSFDGVTLQSVDETTAAGSGVVVVQLCLDVSGSDIINTSGVSIVDKTLPARSPYVVSFDWQDPANPGTLLVGSQSPLLGAARCE
ncbi:hypothetical protein [Cryobacterium melibiosiphilum]|nr:hypothetical protein [Cryobacterium melibiosiphilum]